MCNELASNAIFVCPFVLLCTFFEVQSRVLAVHSGCDL